MLIHYWGGRGNDVKQLVCICLCVNLYRENMHIIKLRYLLFMFKSAFTYPSTFIPRIKQLYLPYWRVTT